MIHLANPNDVFGIPEAGTSKSTIASKWAPIPPFLARAHEVV